MAWYEGTIPNTSAGVILSILDSILPQNQYWSIFDNAAGTNKRVYKNECSAKNSLFYLEVDNDYSGYFLARLWEGWNTETHAGVGASTSQGRFNFQAGGYGVALNDTRVIFGAKTSGTACYFGQPKRFVETLNMPYIVVIQGTGTTNQYNPLGLFGETTGCCLRRLLFGYSGGSDRVGSLLWWAYSDTRPLKTPNGLVLLEEQQIIENNEKLVGRQDGVISAGQSSSEFSNQDVVWEGDIGWLVFKGQYGCCLVRMA